MGLIISKLSRMSLKDEEADSEKSVNYVISPNEQNLKTPKDRFIADHILDPRSATLGIKRTPLVLAKIGNGTPVRPKTYLETDLDETVRSEISFTSEIEESCDENVLNIEEEKEVYSEKECDEDNKSYPDIPDVVSSDFSDELSQEKVKKPFIYEDDMVTSQSTPLKPKGGRTPLGVVSTNNSPLPSPLGKQWRGFREERLRLGLENTPPNQEPFLDVVQSAPGKVGAKRNVKKSWARTHWALDESIVI